MASTAIMITQTDMPPPSEPAKDRVKLERKIGTRMPQATHVESRGQDLSSHIVLAMWLHQGSDESHMEPSMLANSAGRWMASFITCEAYS